MMIKACYTLVQIHQFIELINANKIKSFGMDPNMFFKEEIQMTEKYCFKC